MITYEETLTSQESSLSFASKPESKPFAEHVYRFNIGELRAYTNDPDFIEPEWLLITLEKIQELASLGDNWDSYGACKINQKTLIKTIVVMFELLDQDCPAPSVIPIPDGNVQLEWHQKGVDIELEIHSHGLAHYYLYDLDTEEELEGVFSGDLRNINKFLQKLI